MLARGTWIVSIAAWLWAGTASAQTLPRGQIVEAVTTLAGPKARISAHRGEFR